MTNLLVVCLVAATLSSATSGTSPRNIQILSIDLLGNVIEIFNFGDVDQPLDGWRICTHSLDQADQCTDPNGLDGFVIERHSSLHVHLEDDSPGGPDHVDASSLGAFADIEREPFAIQLYFPPVDLDDGMTMADHVQFSTCKPPSNPQSSNERSDEAVAGGLWTDVSDWILIAPDIESVNPTITLLDASGGELHGPKDYNFEIACGGACGPSICPKCDLDGDGRVTGLDISIITSSANWGLPVDSAAERCADVNKNGLIEGLDVAACATDSCWGL